MLFWTFIRPVFIPLAAAAAVPGRGDAGVSTAAGPSSNVGVSPRTYFRPVRVPALHDVQCRNENEFPGHSDINERRQFRGCNKFCGDPMTDRSFDASDDIESNPRRVARVARYRYRDESGVNHDFKIHWEPGCKVAAASQSLQYPLGTAKLEPLHCSGLMRSIYQNCKNGGIGGTVKAGCLIYSYTGGRGDRDHPLR